MDLFTIKQWLFLLILANVVQWYVMYLMWKGIVRLLEDNVHLGRMIKQLKDE